MSLGSFASLCHELKPFGAQRLQFIQAPMIRAPLRQLEIFQRDRVKVVVGKRDEPEPQAPQFDHFLHYGIDCALARFLAVGLPYRAERAMLGAAAHGLHGRPHIPIGREQIPSRAKEVLGVDLSAFMDNIELAVEAPFDRLAPRDVAVTLDDGVAPAEAERFVRIERGVDAAVDDERAPVAGDLADLVSPQGVARVDPDADDVAGRDARRVELLQRLVGDARIAVLGRCRCR